MSWRRQERRAMEKAMKKAIKTGRGACVLSDGTIIVVTRDLSICGRESPVQFELPAWNQMIGKWNDPL
jgi:hypothetical protein